MEASKIQVAETGNKRHGVLSKEDVQQACNDIAEWFKTNAKSYFDANFTKGGVEASAEVADEHLKILLSKFNGGMHFLDTFRGLSLAEIKSAKKDSLTPFARDLDGNLQCVDQ